MTNFICIEIVKLFVLQSLRQPAQATKPFADTDAGKGVDTEADVIILIILIRLWNVEPSLPVFKQVKLGLVGEFIFSLR